MSHDKMKIYEDVKELVEDEIHKIVKKDDIDEQCLMHLDKLVDIAKDVDTIFAMNDYSEEEGGYSQMRRPMYYNDGEMMPMNGNSYQRRDSMGRYSNNRYNMNRGYDNRYGGYSREGELANRLQSLMDEATTDREREAIRNALNQI
jgi:hypothetical protein